MKTSSYLVGVRVRVRVRVLPGEEVEDLLAPAELALVGELEHLLFLQLLSRLVEDGEDELLVLDGAGSEVVADRVLLLAEDAHRIEHLVRVRVRV